jgi:hypothetical protein
MWAFARVFTLPMNTVYKHPHMHIFSIAPYHLHLIPFYPHMSPKSVYTVPMGNVVEVVTHTTRSGRGIRSRETEVPFHSSRALGSKRNMDVDASESRVHVSSHTSDGEETHPLRVTNVQGDMAQDLDEGIHVDEEQFQSSVGSNIVFGI